MFCCYGLQIKELRETSLSANQDKSGMKTKKWRVADDPGSSSAPIRGRSVHNTTLVVELGPMEIRTFLLKFWCIQLFEKIDSFQFCGMSLKALKCVEARTINLLNNCKW